MPLRSDTTRHGCGKRALKCCTATYRAAASTMTYVSAIFRGSTLMRTAARGLSLAVLGCALASSAIAAPGVGGSASPANVSAAPAAAVEDKAVAAPSAPAPGQAIPTDPGKRIAGIGYLDAQDLAARCSRSDSSSSSYCFAYLAAVTDTARAYEIWLGSREFCLPGGLAQADIRRAFMSYVSAYPAQVAGQAASVVINALKQTYPCD